MPELVHMDEDTLTHYGRLGMKWGQHIFGKERRLERSYKKLSKYAKKAGKAFRDADTSRVISKGLIAGGLYAPRVGTPRKELLKLARFHANEFSRYESKGIKYAAKVRLETQSKAELYMNSEKGRRYAMDLIQQVSVPFNETHSGGARVISAEHKKKGG